MTMKNTPASEIHQLGSRRTCSAMNLVTSLDTVELLTGASICKANPMPANCREIPARQRCDAGRSRRPPRQNPLSLRRLEATTPKEADMRFVLVRGSNPLCNPDCPEWISAEGAITAQTPEKLRQALDAIAGRRLPIVISSQGGDVESALAAGRLIRERKLDVVVAHTDFVDCDPCGGLPGQGRRPHRAHHRIGGRMCFGLSRSWLPVASGASSARPCASA